MNDINKLIRNGNEVAVIGNFNASFSSSSARSLNEFAAFLRFPPSYLL